MLLVCFLVTATPAHAAEPAPPPSAAVVPPPSQWLSDYDGIRLVLVAEDDSMATTAAQSLASSAGGDTDLAAAALRVAAATGNTVKRAAFSDLSRLVVLRASAPGAPRVLVYHCSMFAGFAYWIQTKAGSRTRTWARPCPSAGKSVVHLGESQMPGDVDLNALGDADVGVRWSHEAKVPFFGGGAALTFPSGVVSTDGVSTGRGALGAAANAFVGARVHPKLALVIQASGAGGFGPDPSGYVVAPTASLLAGAKWWTRENGDLNLSLYVAERWSGLDRKDDLIYENTGYLITDLALAANWTFWKAGNRSASLSARVQAPVYQVVGDPGYAENVGGGLGFGVVAF